MVTAAAPTGRDSDRLMYQVDETPPPALTFALGAQLVMLSIGSIVFHPTLVHRAAGSTDELIAWVVFVSLILTAVISALQAFPFRRFGAGYLLVTSTVAPGIAVCTDALKAGGAGLLAALMVASALFQLVFAARIAMFRRILTPCVSGTILMLISVSVAPIVFDRITDVPPGHSQADGFVCALVTLAVVVLVALMGRRRLRPWAAVIGVGAGALVSIAYGLYDLEFVAQAPWFGLPASVPLAFAFDVGPSFWTLLPAFLLVSVACTIRTMRPSALRT